MAFGLFGSASDVETTNNTELTDASANAGEGATALSGGSSLSITNNTVAPEVTRQAFEFGSGAVDTSVNAVRDVAALGLIQQTEIARDALDSGLESLRINANLVPDLLDASSSNTRDVLRAAQEQTNLAQQYASQGASLARAAATGGASTLLEGSTPLILGMLALGVAGLWLATRGAKR
jgi:hypothetical protein